MLDNNLNNLIGAEEMFISKPSFIIILKFNQKIQKHAARQFKFCT